METPIEKHKRLESELLSSKFDLVYDPTPMPLNKLGRLKFLYLDQLKGYEHLTGVELARILHQEGFIKIVKYVSKSKEGRFQPPELRYVNLNYLAVSDLPRILKVRDVAAYRP